MGFASTRSIGWCLTDAEDRGQSATNRFWLAEADAASPSGRILRPEDTAASVVHLLSESASSRRHGRK